MELVGVIGRELCGGTEMTSLFAAIGQRKLNDGAIGLHIIRRQQFPIIRAAIDVGVCFRELVTGYIQNVLVIGLPHVWGWCLCWLSCGAGARRRGTCGQDQRQ